MRPSSLLKVLALLAAIIWTVLMILLGDATDIVGIVIFSFAGMVFGSGMYWTLRWTSARRFVIRRPVAQR